MTETTSNSLQTPSKPDNSITKSDASPEVNEGPETSTSTSNQKVRKRRLDVNPNLILSEGRSKRRRTPTPEPEVKVEVKNESIDRKKVKELGRVIYGKIMSRKDTECVSAFCVHVRTDQVLSGLLMSEPFIKLPSKVCVSSFVWFFVDRKYSGNYQDTMKR